MDAHDLPVDEFARSFGHTAAAAFRDTGMYFRELPADAWHDPTGAADWDMTALGGHVVGEAVWFPHLVRTVTEGVAPLPHELWEQLKQLPPQEMAERMLESADAMMTAVDGATRDHLLTPVDLGWAKLELWRALYIAAVEGVYHNWDARAGRRPDARIPAGWAHVLASSIPMFAPNVVHRKFLNDATGTYQLEVSDGPGDVSLVVREDGVELVSGKADNPAARISLDTDQFVRFVAGRCPLQTALERGQVAVSGDTSRLAALDKLFGGIANADRE